jgi:hypothetical protein
MFDIPEPNGCFSSGRVGIMRGMSVQEEPNTEKNDGHPKLSDDGFHYDGVKGDQYKAMGARHCNSIYCTVAVWHGKPLQERIGIRRSNQRSHIDDSDDFSFVRKVPKICSIVEVFQQVLWR